MQHPIYRIYKTNLDYFEIRLSCPNDVPQFMLHSLSVHVQHATTPEKDLTVSRLLHRALINLWDLESHPSIKLEISVIYASTNKLETIWKELMDLVKVNNVIKLKHENVNLHRLKIESSIVYVVCNSEIIFAVTKYCKNLLVFEKLVSELKSLKNDLTNSKIDNTSL
jgi:hypothetical protein